MPASAHELAFVGDIVDQDVLAQPIWRGHEHPSGINAHQVIDELHHVRRTFQHERVDRDPIAGATDNFPQCLLKRPRCGWVAEANVAIVEVRRRLTIRDDDDLAVGPLLPIEYLPRELEAVLHVCAVVVFVPIE